MLGPGRRRHPVIAVRRTAYLLAAVLCAVPCGAAVAVEVTVRGQLVQGVDEVPTPTPTPTPACPGSTPLTEPLITVGSVTGFPAQQVTLPIALTTNGPQVYSILLQLAFDPSALAF